MTSKHSLALIFFLSFILANQLNAQNRVLYTGIVNVIPGDKQFPLFGLVNIVGGDHESVQLGLLNHSQGSFSGFQGSLKNQGVVNMRGCQMSLINSVSKDVTGAQFGLLNSAEETQGAQMGLLNTTTEDVDGAQIGLLNRTEEVMGAQIGLLNIAKEVEGVQIGLVNKSDTVGSGVPIGLLYLGKGGMFTLDVGTTEMHPIQVSLRTGIEKLYFMLSTAFSNNRGGYLLLGTGVGTKVPINQKTSLSPEFQYLTGLSTRNNFDYYSISLNYGIETSDRMSISIGPSFGYNLAHQGRNISTNPAFLNLAKNEGTSRLQFVAGFRASVRFDLSKR